MKYTNEFKEKAQNELSKRLGYNNIVECVQSLGSKQFKRKCDEFYSEYFKEVNKNRFIVKKVPQPILKSEPSKRYINNEKAITKIEISLREMAKLIEQGNDNSVRLFISECFITNIYLTILRRLGYLTNLNHRKDPKYFLNIKGSDYRIVAEKMFKEASKDKSKMYQKRKKIGL